MVITIAKAYKRGGNVACVTDADMFLTEVSSIIIHRSEELMLPLCRRLRQRTLHQLLRYNQRGFRRKIRGRRYLPHAEGLRRYLKICDFRGNTLRRLDTELRHGQLRALQGRPQHHHFFVVSIPVIIALGAFICVLVIKRCFRPLAPIKDSLSDIRTFLSGVFSEISEAAGAVYSGANNVYQGANELAESCVTADRCSRRNFRLRFGGQQHDL